MGKQKLGNNRPKAIQEDDGRNQKRSNSGLAYLVKDLWQASMVPLAGGAANGFIEGGNIPVPPGTGSVAILASILSAEGVAVYHSIITGAQMNGVKDMVGFSIAFVPIYALIGTMFYGIGYATGYGVGKAAEKLF